jgi:polysaccharide biosynthesis transport protein
MPCPWKTRAILPFITIDDGSIRLAISESLMIPEQNNKTGKKRVIMNSQRARTLTDYVRAARRRKSFIILTALVFIIAAHLSLKRVASIYESHATFIIETLSATDPSRRVNALQQQVTNRARLEAVIAKHELFKQEIEKGTRVDDLISQMRAGITVGMDSNRENQFIISYRASDPAIAHKVAAELAEQLLSENSKATPDESQGGETDPLRKRAADMSSQLRQLEERAPWLLTINEATTITPSPSAPRISQETLRAQQMTIESLKDRQYLIQQQLADLERRITTQRQVIEQQKKNSTLRDNPTYAVLISKRTELQGQRDTLINRQELTDKHPRVTAITDQINAINRQIEELRQMDAGQVSQSAEARELGSLESERNRLKLELEINNREMARRMSNPPVQASTPAPAANSARRDGASARLARQYLGLKRNYEELMVRVQEAESKRQPSPIARPERFRLLDQATLPGQPIWPNRWPLIFSALTVGLALGACFAVLAESRRLTSIQDARDVELYTRAPLLAAIPRTLTATERKLAGRKVRLRLALGTVIAAVATFALSEIFIITDILALLSKK